MEEDAEQFSAARSHTREPVCSTSVAVPDKLALIAARAGAEVDWIATLPLIGFEKARPRSRRGT